VSEGQANPALSLQRGEDGGMKSVRAKAKLPREPFSKLWYHWLRKGWDCPGHPESYKSIYCKGARKVQP